MIQDEEYQDNNIKVLKFVEANDNDEFTKQKLTTPLEQTDTKDKTTVKEADTPSIDFLFSIEYLVKVDAERSVEEVDKSDHESSISAGMLNLVMIYIIRNRSE
jgi:hypothetical protein